MQNSNKIAPFLYLNIYIMFVHIHIFSYYNSLIDCCLTLLVRRFQIYRTSYATFIFNVIKIVQKRLENGSFDGSRCALCTTRLYLRRIDLNVVTICYFDKFMIFFLHLWLLCQSTM